MINLRRVLILSTATCAVLAAVALIAWKTGLARRLYIRIGQGPSVQVVETPLTNPKIVVEKTARKLHLYADDKLVATYRIGLGFGADDGDKVRQGDGRTPEGEFYVCGKNPRSPFYLALNLSYPMVEDAERGLREGLIDAKSLREVVSAIERRRQPPWDTPLGGAILIHGHGSHRDWTLGCVALDDEEMLQLYEAVPVGTSVIIHP